MSLDSTLASYLARTASFDLGEASPVTAPGADAQARLMTDLAQVSRSSTIWCAAMIALVVGLGVASMVVASGTKAASIAGAGALVVALQRTWRRKIATDLLIAFLKASGDDPRAWRKIVAELRKQI